jgi:hypothetical protein
VDEDQAMAARIADNKVAESPWDEELLKFDFGKLIAVAGCLPTCTLVQLAQLRRLTGTSIRVLETLCMIAMDPPTSPLSPQSISKT